MADPLLFVAVPAKGVIITTSGFEMDRATTVTVGDCLRVLLMAGGPHPPLDLIAGSRGQLLAQQAELRDCYRAMGWTKGK